MKAWCVVLFGILAAATAAAQSDSASGAATGAAVASRGKMLVTSSGTRLGVVYRVNADGSPQLIVDGKMVTIPATTLTDVDGKLTTSLSKKEIAALH